MQTKSPGIPEVVIKAVTRLWRPLVRLLLSNGVQLPVVVDHLKATYVDVANREFRVTGKDQTQSRISLLTGVHRKDVKRLIGLKRQHDPIPEDLSLGIRIAARWLSDPGFLDAAGRPLPLPRSASKGGAQSFEGLVEHISKDIRPRSVLDEWLRLGVAEVSADDMVRLKADAFVPAKGFEQKVYFLGQNIHDHLATAVQNVGGQAAPLLERSVLYEGLYEDSVAELAELARQEGMRALLEVNRRAMELQQRDIARGHGQHRMNFGLYFFRGRQEDQEDANDT